MRGTSNSRLGSSEPQFQDSKSKTPSRPSQESMSRPQRGPNASKPVDTSEPVDRLEICGFFKIMKSNKANPALVVLQILNFDPEYSSVILSDGIYKDSLRVGKNCAATLFTEAKAFDIIWAKAYPKDEFIGLLSWELIYSGMRGKIGKPEICPIEADDMRYPPGNYGKCKIKFDSDASPISIEESSDELNSKRKLAPAERPHKVESFSQELPRRGSNNQAATKSLDSEPYLGKIMVHDSGPAISAASPIPQNFKSKYGSFAAATSYDDALPSQILPEIASIPTGSKFSAYQRHSPSQNQSLSPTPAGQRSNPLPRATSPSPFQQPEPRTGHLPETQHHTLHNRAHAYTQSQYAPQPQNQLMPGLQLLHTEGYVSDLPPALPTFPSLHGHPNHHQNLQSHHASVLDCTPLNKLAVSAVGPQILCRVESLTPLCPYKSPLGGEKYFFKALVFDQYEKVVLTFFDPVSQGVRDKLKEGGLYIFGRGEVQTQKKEFSVTRSPYQVTFGKSIRLYKVDEQLNAAGQFGALGIPKVYDRDMYALKELEELTDGEVISVMGVVDSIFQFTDKEDQNQAGGQGNNNQQQGGQQNRPPKTTYLVRLYDESRAEISVKFWESTAGIQELAKNTVIHVLNLRLKVQQTNSRRLDSTAYTKIIHQSALQTSDKLEKLLEFKSMMVPGNGPRPTMTALTILQKKAFPLRTISEIYTATDTLVDGTALEDKMFFECQAHVADFGNQMYYESCPLEQCQKKVKVKEGGQIECPNCGLFSKSIRPEARFVAHITFSDHTGNLQAVFHQESIGKVLIGMTANQVRESIQENEPEFRSHLESRKYRLFTFGLISKIYDTGRQKVAQHRIVYATETGLTPHKIKDLNKQMIDRVRRFLNFPDTRYQAEEFSRPRPTFDSKFSFKFDSRQVAKALPPVVAPEYPQATCDWEDSMR